MKDKLTAAERGNELEALLRNGWAMVEGRDAVTRMYRFSGFVEAFGWMTRTAIYAEKWNHHPEWANVYDRVTVTLCSHDVDGLSMRDIRLARKMDQLAGQG